MSIPTGVVSGLDSQRLSPSVASLAPAVLVGPLVRSGPRDVRLTLLSR